MKKIKYLLIICLGIFTLSSCVSYHRSHGRGNNGLPPGQVKKVTGAKSARAYAPGQRKKRAKRHPHHRIDYMPVHIHF